MTARPAGGPSSCRLMHSHRPLATVVGVALQQAIQIRPPTPAGRPWLVTAAVGACAALAALTMARWSFPHGGAAGQGILVAVALGSPVATLRRWPPAAVAAMAIATAANCLCLAWSGQIVLPLAAMLGLAMYIAAARLGRRRSLALALAASAALGGVLAYVAFTMHMAPVLGDAVVLFIPLTAAWFIGDSSAARRRYLAGLAGLAERERAAEAERARQAVREERVRIAREMHDVVAHTLAVITVQAGVASRLAARQPGEAHAALESIETIGRTAQEELRVVLGLLRDEDAGAAALAPMPRLADLHELADTVRTSGTPVELDVSGTDRHLSPALQLSIYRVVQEGLTNVVKHVPGGRATVGLAVSASEVRLVVADDGGPGGRAACPEGNVPRLAGSGLGIVGMRERVGAFGGSLHAGPLPGGGFKVTATVPVEGTA